MAFTGNVQNVILPSPKNLPTIGGLYRGPLGTTVPTSLATIASAMKQQGFVAEGGIDENEDRPTTKIFAWGSDIVAEPQDSYALNIVFTLYEFLNPEVAKTAYGTNNVTVTAADATHGTRLSILQTSDVFEDSVWCWDAFAPGGKRVQKWFPIGRVINKDTMTTNHKTVLSHRLTVGFYADSNGAYSRTLTDDGIIDAS
jgi:hypothetical protein